jgi:hypothetical protein
MTVVNFRSRMEGPGISRRQREGCYVGHHNGKAVRGRRWYPRRIVHVSPGIAKIELIWRAERIAKIRAFMDWQATQHRARVTGWEAWIGFMQGANITSEVIGSSRSAYDEWLIARRSVEPDRCLIEAWFASRMWCVVNKHLGQSLQES